MALASIPSVVPARVIAGDTWRWDRALSDFTPADGWVLTTYFRGVGALDVVGVANAGGSGWENTATAVLTAPLKAGVYQWSEFVAKAGERYPGLRGVVDVRPNPALQNAGDARPWEEAAVEALERYIAGTADEGMLEFQIAGRAVKLLSPKEAMDQLDRLTDRLARKRSRGRRPVMVPEFHAR